MEMILIVDDDHTSRNMLGVFIRKLHPDVVIVYADGAEAWEIINSPGSEFSLLISDAQTSQMPGPELVEKVREKYPHVRTILMSGESEPEGHKAHSFSPKNSLTAHLAVEIRKLMGAK